MITINIPSKDLKTNNMGEAIDTIEEQCRKLFKPDSITVRYNFEKEEYTLFVVNPTIKTINDEKESLQEEIKTQITQYQGKYQTEKTTNIPPIGIDEAIHDYLQAYYDYKTKNNKLRKYYENDVDVLTANLEQYFQKENMHITVNGVYIFLKNSYIENTCIDNNFIRKIQELDCDYIIDLECKEITIIMDTNLEE